MRFLNVAVVQKKRLCIAYPGVGNQRGDVRDWGTRGVKRANLQAVLKARGGKGAKIARKLQKNIQNQKSKKELKKKRIHTLFGDTGSKFASCGQGKAR